MKDSDRYEKLPIVRFISGQEVVVGADSFELEAHGKEKIRAKRTQIPLRLSWAITIHKSQGMSLDYLKVDCSRSFEAGQAYVALSRARSIEGLQVLSFDARKCWCDPKVVEFYKTGITRLTDEVCDEISSAKPSKKPFTGGISERIPKKPAHKQPTSEANPLMARIVSALTCPKRDLIEEQRPLQQPSTQYLVPLEKARFTSPKTKVDRLYPYLAPVESNPPPRPFRGTPMSRTVSSSPIDLISPVLKKAKTNSNGIN